MNTPIEYIGDSLKKGELVIINDDIWGKSSYLLGLAESVTPQNINTLTNRKRFNVCMPSGRQGK